MAGLTNKQKAAILILSLGADTASKILKHLEEYQIEEISREISRLGAVKPEMMHEVIREFHEIMLAGMSAKGGMAFLREVLEKALGPSRTMSIINRLSEVQPFTYIKDVSAARLAAVLSKEHPQAIAIVLSYIPSNQAAEVLAQLPEELKLNVSLRIAGLKDVRQEAINDINEALQATLSSHQGHDTFESASPTESGTRVLAEILNRAERKTETAILENLQKINTGLSEEVRKQMFIFEDIMTLDDKSLQRIIREVDSKDLTLSLKLADEALKERIFKNMSERARDILKEELNFMAPVRIRHVEEAQQKVLVVVRRLEQAGEITISKQGAEEKFV